MASRGLGFVASETANLSLAATGELGPVDARLCRGGIQKSMRFRKERGVVQR